MYVNTFRTMVSAVLINLYALSMTPFSKYC